MNMKTSLMVAQRGFGMIEVLIAVLVMAIGFMILAGLQVRLIEGEADARSRTVATRLAADQIEQMRSFGEIADYIALTSSAATESMGKFGGTNLTKRWTVTRYRYNPDPNADGDRSDAGFQELAATENTTSLEQQPEFKHVQVVIGWKSATGKAREVVVEDLISSSAPKDGVGTLKSDSGSRVNPIVRVYKPSDVGVIPIAVGQDSDGNTVSSSASNPKPTHYAEGATGTTKFTVQNYLSDTGNPLLQRQLDFAYAACSCKLSGVSTTASPAFTVSYWNGVRYTTPEPVSGKPIGVVNTGVDQDGQLCESCCRDHHDATSQAIKADPFRWASAAGVANYNPSGDHLHFNAQNGFSSPAGESQAYSETCRMIRVDGIYRVSTDTRLEDISILRMDSTPSIGVGLLASYAEFAQKAVKAAYQAKTAAYPVGGLPFDKATVGASYELPALSTYSPKFIDENRDHKLFALKSSKQYFAARGIYIDWISPKAQEKINCIGSNTDVCGPYKNMNLL